MGCHSGVRGVLVGSLAVLALSACGSSDEQQVAAPVKAVKHEQTPDDPTAKMARAVPIGGATAPVNIKYEILNKPIVGSPIEIDLAVIPTQVADSMTITYAGSSGLTLSADAAPPINVVKTGQPERLKISAQAQHETVFYVTVTATVYVAGTSSARVFAIPIIVSAQGATVEQAAPAAATKKS
jgi:hypothetical protein